MPKDFTIPRGPKHHSSGYKTIKDAAAALNDPVIENIEEDIHLIRSDINEAYDAMGMLLIDLNKMSKRIDNAYFLIAVLGLYQIGWLIGYIFSAW